MPSTALEQQRYDVLMDACRPSQRRPANDVPFVHVAEAVHVAAGLEQRAHDLEVSVRGRPMQSIRIVACLACVGIGAMCQQQAHRVDMPVLGGFVQAGPPARSVLRVHHVDPSQGSILRQQAAQDFDVSLGAGLDEGGGLGRPPLLDFGLERAPAGEPVVSRHSEQSGRQLGASVGPAHVPQPVLRQLFQILEGGAVGELGIRHTPFLPCLPGVRASGWKSGSLVIDER